MYRPSFSLRAWILAPALLCLVVAAGAVSLDLTLQAPTNLQAYFLQDLNLSGQGLTQEVFRAEVFSDLQQSTEAYFTFSLNNAQIPVASGKSINFTLNPGPLTITNLDLTNPGTPYRLQDYNITSEAQDIQDRALETGYLPSGIYVISLKLWQTTPDSLLASDEVIFSITNPFVTQIIAPAGTPGFPGMVGSTLPLFAWSSQASQYLLKICERTTSDQDAESVLQNTPNYQTDPSQPLTSSSFVYPAAGAKPLESGHTYYWQVTALVQTSGGLRPYPSSIAAFTINTNPDPLGQRIMAAVQTIMNSGDASILEELVGFQPTGELRLDGTGVNVEDLEAVASKISRGECHLKIARVQ
jgi:hypothetical protein